MKTDKYIKAIIETGCMECCCMEDYCMEINFSKELIINRDKIYPGNVYTINRLLLLCTCYQVDDSNNTSEYFFVILDDKIKNKIKIRNIKPTKLKLLKNILNINNYTQIIDML